MPLYLRHSVIQEGRVNLRCASCERSCKVHTLVREHGHYTHIYIYLYIYNAYTYAVKLNKQSSMMTTCDAKEGIWRDLSCSHASGQAMPFPEYSGEDKKATESQVESPGR